MGTLRRLRHMAITIYMRIRVISIFVRTSAQGRIQDFSKKGVVSMRNQGKRPRGKGMGEGRVMFEYVDFLYFDFRYKFVKFETLLLNTKSTVQHR